MFYQQLPPTSKPNVNCHFLRVSPWQSEWSYTSKTTSSRSGTARRSREVVMTATTVHQSASLVSRHSLDRAAEGGGGGEECYQPAGGREGGATVWVQEPRRVEAIPSVLYSSYRPPTRRTRRRRRRMKSSWGSPSADTWCLLFVQWSVWKQIETDKLHRLFTAASVWVKLEMCFIYTFYNKHRIHCIFCNI